MCSMLCRRKARSVAYYGWSIDCYQVTMQSQSPFRWGFRACTLEWVPRLLDPLPPSNVKPQGGTLKSHYNWPREGVHIGFHVRGGILSNFCLEASMRFPVPVKCRSPHHVPNPPESKFRQAPQFPAKHRSLNPQAPWPAQPFWQAFCRSRR